MYQVTVNLLPNILMTCFGDASVGFHKNMDSVTLSDNFKFNEEDTKVVWDNSGFTIGNINFSYMIKYNYKDIPILLEYLKSLNLVMPKFT